MKKYCLDGEIAEFDYHSADGFWAFCGPKSLKAFLGELETGEKAEIEINSPGGSVICGVEMANAIKNSGAHLIAHVTGMAASMASVIACACREIVLEEASFMMIHDPWTELAGNAADLRKEADVLDLMKSMILSFYRGKFSKCDDAELARLMSETTYMSAGECVAAGLECSVVKSDVRYAAKLTARDLAKAPEAARAFFNTAEMPEEVKAEIEKAREAARAEADREAGHRDADDWEARYKGASKKINELQNRIVELERQAESAAVESVDHGTVVAERDGLKEEVAALKDRIATLEKTDGENVQKIVDLNSQLEKSGRDLADANAKVSELAANLEKSEKELARKGQQLDRLVETRDLLTGCVLTPTDGGSTYEAKMAAAKTPEEREELRAQKRAGKIK